MVNQVFDAVYFDKHFNPVIEEASEWKECEREQATRKKARQLIRHCIILIRPSSIYLTVAMMQDYADHSRFCI